MRHPEPLALICLALMAAHAQADALGRLFYTPEQRRQLERGAADGTAPHMLKGIVQTHGGRRTIWLGDRVESHTGNAHQSSQLVIGPDNTAVRVKVGESVP